MQDTCSEGPDKTVLTEALPLESVPQPQALTLPFQAACWPVSIPRKGRGPGLPEHPSTPPSALAHQCPLGLTWSASCRKHLLSTLATELGGFVFRDMLARRTLHTSREGASQGQTVPADLEGRAADRSQRAIYHAVCLSCDHSPASVSFSGKVNSQQF